MMRTNEKITASRTGGPGPVRLAGRSAEVPAFDLFEWLATQPFPHVFWRDRPGVESWAGSGAALDLSADGGGALGASIERARGALAEADTDGNCPRRAFGGGAFDPADPSIGRWAGFRGARFVLPRLVARRQGDRCTVAAWGSSAADASSALESALAAPVGAARGRQVAGRRAFDPSERQQWRESVNDILGAIRARDVAKVVLARRARVEADAAFDPIAIAAALASRTERSAAFLLDFGEGSAFAGASPELLLRARGASVESECVAGTAPRGLTSEEDDARAAAVLASEKDRREHGFVVSAVRGAFERHCEEVLIDARPHVLTLASVHHLRVAVRGSLRSPRALPDLLAALHPTPAVGGTPRQRALEILRAIEAGTRGWYAGPVGWIEPGAAEFFVGIRSALIEGARADAFAGSGIVEGSDADTEWAETEAKLRPMIEILTREGV